MAETPEHRAERLARLAAELRLTPKERRWAEAYAADPTQNKQACAAAAGYKQPGRHGCLLAKRGKVLRYVEALKTEAQQAANARTAGAIMDAAEIEEWLSRVKRVNIAEAVRRARESGDMLRGLEDVGDLIERIRVTRGGLDVTFSKRHAVALGMRSRGMLRDRVEHAGKDGAPLNATVVFTLPDNGRRAK